MINIGEVFSFFFKSKGDVTIGGTAYSGRSVSIKNNEVWIDGKKVQDIQQCPKLEITIQGEVQELKCTSGDIRVMGNVGTLKTTSGDINCGNVGGNVNSVSGDVACLVVSGNVSTVSGDIKR